MGKVRQYMKCTHKQPTASVWNGACKEVVRLNQLIFSNLSITSGNNIIPGAAMKILENVTWEIPLTAAIRLLPISFPFSS